MEEGSHEEYSPPLSAATMIASTGIATLKLVPLKWQPVLKKESMRHRGEGCSGTLPAVVPLHLLQHWPRNDYIYAPGGNNQSSK